MKRILSLMSAVVVSFMAFANEEISGKVVSVIDGNTLQVIDDAKETYKILLHGIDCPELEQEYGAKAKKLLEKLVLEKEVQVKIVLACGSQRIQLHHGFFAGSRPCFNQNPANA